MTITMNRTLEVVEGRRQAGMDSTFVLPDTVATTSKDEPRIVWLVRIVADEEDEEEQMASTMMGVVEEGMED